MQMGLLPRNRDAGRSGKDGWQQLIEESFSDLLVDFKIHQQEIPFDKDDTVEDPPVEPRLHLLGPLHSQLSQPQPQSPHDCLKVSPSLWQLWSAPNAMSGPTRVGRGKTSLLLPL